MTEIDNKNKGGKIVLLIFLLICGGLGIAAFVMSMTKCKKDGFAARAVPLVEADDDDAGPEAHVPHRVYNPIAFDNQVQPSGKIRYYH